MTNWKTLYEGVLLSWLVAVLGGCLAFPKQAAAQNIVVNPASQGEKAVWQNSSTISGSVTVIDASAFCFSATGYPCSGNNGQAIDFCKVLNAALDSIPSVLTAGVVVDARGIVPGQHDFGLGR